MRTLLIILSLAGLGLTILPSVFVFHQEMTLETHKLYMLFGMVLWFVTAPLWIKEQKL